MVVEQGARLREQLALADVMFVDDPRRDDAGGDGGMVDSQPPGELVLLARHARARAQEHNRPVGAKGGGDRFEEGVGVGFLLSPREVLGVVGVTEIVLRFRRLNRLPLSRLSLQPEDARLAMIDQQHPSLILAGRLEGHAATLVEEKTQGGQGLPVVDARGPWRVEQHAPAGPGGGEVAVRRFGDLADGLKQRTN